MGRVTNNDTAIADWQAKQSYVWTKKIILKQSLLISFVVYNTILIMIIIFSLNFKIHPVVRVWCKIDIFAITVFLLDNLLECSYLLKYLVLYFDVFGDLEHNYWFCFI